MLTDDKGFSSEKAEWLSLCSATDVSKRVKSLKYRI